MENEEIFLEFDLPGFEKDEIKVEFQKNLAKVHASKKKELREERKGYLHEELTKSEFSYQTTLPKEADTNNASISFEDNTLTIRIPKKH